MGMQFAMTVSLIANPLALTLLTTPLLPLYLSVTQAANLLLDIENQCS